GDGSGENGLGSNRWSRLIKYVNRKYDKKYESKPASSWNNKNNSSKDVVMAEWPTLQEQLSFVKYELVNGVSSRRGTLNFSKLNSYGVEDATYWFAAIYENPAEKKFQKTLNNRKKEAERVYKMYCSKI
ncbi:MAG: phage tail tip lysozyme, partial [Leptotrichiaceae bacterium]